MAKFLVLMRMNGPWPEFSAQQFQEVALRYRNWRDRLHASGQKLEDGSGRVLTQSDGRIVITDGPFAETKEVVAGYFLVDATDYSHAVELCRDCPHLEFGSLEVRAFDGA